MKRLKSGEWNEAESVREYIQRMIAYAGEHGRAITVCLYSRNRWDASEAEAEAPVEVNRMVEPMLGTDEFGVHFKGDEYAAVFQKRQGSVRASLEELRAQLRESGREENFCYGLVEILPEHTITAREALLLAGERMYEQKRQYRIYLNEMRRQKEETASEAETFEYNKDLLYDALVQSTDDYIYVCNMKTGVFRYTKKMVEDFELPGEVISNAAASWGARVHEDDRPAFLESNQEIADGKVSAHCVEYRARNRNGEWVWVRCRGHLEFDEKGEPELFAGFITNMGKRNRIDHLTGLPNKLEFEERIQQLIQEGGSMPFGIMALGIDNLKHINDLYGRVFGDEVIRIVSQRLQSLLADRISLYRMDGDEFGIIVWGTDADHVVYRLEQIYRTIHHTFRNQQEYEGKKYSCTLSAGCIIYPDHADNYNNMMQYVGYTLEYSKRHGKNQCTFFSNEILSLRIRKLRMVEALRESVEKDFAGFSLRYQPIVRAEDGVPAGMEALVRWQWEGLGEISPVEFVPLLEESGLIVQVGKWVLRTALHTCRDWVLQNPGLILDVNVSFIQIQDSKFHDTVNQTVEQEQFPPQNLVLELTESYFASGSPVVHRVFKQVRSRGIRVAMDDFGTGYSTLGLLKEAPADVVKIDRTFVKDIQNSNFDATFIRFIVALCHDVGIRVCLEGVETEEEYQMVSSMGLDMIQGFLFSRPLPAEEFADKYMIKEKPGDMP